MTDPSSYGTSAYGAGVYGDPGTPRSARAKPMVLGFSHLGDDFLGDPTVSTALLGAEITTALPANPHAPWRDGPQVFELQVTRPGDGDPVRLSTAGISVGWQVESQQTFSAEVATDDLIYRFGTIDLRGSWLRWTHPTLGVWGGEINDVGSDSSTQTTELAALDFSALLASRRLAKVYDVTAAPPGGLVRRVVRDAGRDAGSYTWVTAFLIEEMGDPITLELRGGKVDEALRTISTNSGHEWWVDEDRVLHWYRRRGRDCSGQVQLVEGRHVHNARYSLALGPIVNDLLVIPSDDTYAKTESLVIEDDASIRQVGRRQDQRLYTGLVTESTLRPLGTQDLRKLTKLGDTVTFDVVNVDGCFAWFREGDTINVLMPTINRRLTVRVMVRTYDTDTGVLSVSGDVEAS